MPLLGTGHLQPLQHRAPSVPDRQNLGRFQPGRKESKARLEPVLCGAGGCGGEGTAGSCLVPIPQEFGTYFAAKSYCPRCAIIWNTFLSPLVTAAPAPKSQIIRGGNCLFGTDLCQDLARGRKALPRTQTLIAKEEH